MIFLCGRRDFSYPYQVPTFSWILGDKPIICLPSRKLTHPTLGQGKSSSKVRFLGNMLIPWRGYIVFLVSFFMCSSFPSSFPHPYHASINHPLNRRPAHVGINLLDHLESLSVKVHRLSRCTIDVRYTNLLVVCLMAYCGGASGHISIVHFISPRPWCSHQHPIPSTDTRHPRRHWPPPRGAPYGLWHRRSSPWLRRCEGIPWDPGSLNGLGRVGWEDIWIYI